MFWNKKQEEAPQPKEYSVDIRNSEEGYSVYIYCSLPSYPDNFNWRPVVYSPIADNFRVGYQGDIPPLYFDTEEEAKAAAEYAKNNAINYANELRLEKGIIPGKAK